MATELTPKMGGKWLVITRSARHVWDLDAQTYMRLPGPSSTAMAFDGEARPIVCVGAWPKLGVGSYLEFEGRATIEWRISSAALSIEPFEME